EAFAREIAFEGAHAMGEQRLAMQRQFVLRTRVAGFTKAPALPRHRDDDHRISTPGKVGCRWPSGPAGGADRRHATAAWTGTAAPSRDGIATRPACARPGWWRQTG